MTRARTSWLPHRCLACDLSVPGGELDLCDLCYGDLPWHGAVDLAAMAGNDGASPLAGVAAQVLAALAYEGAIRRWIARLKFHQGLVEGRLLGQLLAATVVAHYLPAAGIRAQAGPWLELPDAIVPVPLHWRRMLWRGLNQTEVIALPLARRLGLPLLCGAVRRVQRRADQHALSRSERLRLPASAFAIQGPLPERLAIVDDVLTTGATCAALAGALSAAGAREVHVWCVARTELR